MSNWQAIQLYLPLGVQPDLLHPLKWSNCERKGGGSTIHPRSVSVEGGHENLRGTTLCSPLLQGKLLPQAWEEAWTYIIFYINSRHH